jgi:opacity protein-like surface antigen
MKRLALVGLVLALFTARAAAQAAPQPTAAPAASAPSRFSVGAGIGFSSEGLGGLGGVSYSSPALYAGRAFTPVGTALLEAELTQRLRLGVGLSGSYTSSRERDGREDARQPRSYPKKVAGAAAAVSLRWIVNPEGVVQVSPLISLGGNWATAKGVSSDFVPATDTEPAYYLEADSDGYGVDARFALVLEHALLPQLYLRFESHFVRLSYSKIEAVTDAESGPRTKESLSQTSFALGWYPVLQLRLTF